MDRQLFARFVEDSQERLRRFLTALCCGDSATADDLAQETYIKAYLASDTFSDTARLTAWTYRVAYNAFVSHRRSMRPTAPVDEAADTADGGDDYQELYIALESLSEKERTAVLLFYIQGYSTREIAQIMESTEAAVRQLLSRGRSRLRLLLNPKKPNDYETRQSHD